MANSPIRVLLVDDSPFVLAVLKKSLSTAPDVEVVGTAKNGKEALAIIDTLNPAVICTDLEMPVMDGTTAAKKIREMQLAGDLVQHIPVIAVTANAREEQIKTTLEAGIVSLVTLLGGFK